MKVVNRELLAVVMAVLAIGVGQASAAPALDETFESYSAGQALPIPPWQYFSGANLDMAYSVADGYSTNTTHVAKVTDKIASDGAYRSGLTGLDSGLAYFEFDIADGGTRHGQEIWLMGNGNNDRVLDIYAISDWKRANGGGGMLGIENWDANGATLIDVMTPGQWYHVKLTLDLDLNTAAGEVDGVSMFSGRPIGNFPITRVGFSAYFAGDFGAGATYWDNLAITPEPTTVALLVLGSLCMVRRRRSA